MNLKDLRFASIHVGAVFDLYIFLYVFFFMYTENDAYFFSYIYPFLCCYSKQLGQSDLKTLNKSMLDSLGEANYSRVSLS